MLTIQSTHKNAHRPVKRIKMHVKTHTHECKRHIHKNAHKCTQTVKTHKNNYIHSGYIRICNQNVIQYEQWSYLLRYIYIVLEMIIVFVVCIAVVLGLWLVTGCYLGLVRILEGIGNENFILFFNYNRNILKKICKCSLSTITNFRF